MFLKNKNIIFKIRRSKVTDYAALRSKSHWFEIHCHVLEQDPLLGTGSTQEMISVIFYIAICMPLQNFSME